jgi:hypothetical protein
VQLGLGLTSPPLLSFNFNKSFIDFFLFLAHQASILLDAIIAMWTWLTTDSAIQATGEKNAAQLRAWTCPDNNHVD